MGTGDRAAALAADLVALGQRLPDGERAELHRIVGELAGLVADAERATHG